MERRTNAIKQCPADTCFSLGTPFHTPTLCWKAFPLSGVPGGLNQRSHLPALPETDHRCDDRATRNSIYGFQTILRFGAWLGNPLSSSTLFWTPSPRHDTYLLRTSASQALFRDPTLGLLPRLSAFGAGVFGGGSSLQPVFFQQSSVVVCRRGCAPHGTVLWCAPSGRLPCEGALYGNLEHHACLPVVRVTPQRTSRWDRSLPPRQVPTHEGSKPSLFAARPRRLKGPQASKTT